ncbi:S-adenosylmethionine synthetase [Evansella caseinilytica]|uniref:S-adenosylmethionine synthase n=1 Tax=Evansella caseinilytica TaxID=1503961 RepID=A0A1H3HZA0_9BACI|nr:methionine adenosyltransferase [Evansella caseinilytica]SDY20138.1 S-adenosylmethionine synthetase [Evansella caseinilytica]
MMKGIQITSESVTEGHPDKLCDQISDGLLDAFLRQDKDAKVALECMIAKDALMIAGEIRSSAEVDVPQIARNIIAAAGYDDLAKGFDSKICLILTNIHQQSPDISIGVDTAYEYRGEAVSGQLSGQKAMGAGDQGIMYGYACSETANLMPLPISLANRLAQKLAEVRKSKLLDYLYPDGKTQVTVQYDEQHRPLHITSIVVSAQHREGIPQDVLANDLYEKVILPVIPAVWLTEQTRILINPTGRFVVGGPLGDTGLTGRKIIVDTYGGVIPHGGGAFSGKDPSKVDRSAAYMCRYAAKNLVAAGLAEKCQIALSYAIGVAAPVSVYVDTFGTEAIPQYLLPTIVKTAFDLTPGGIIKTLDLQRPIYKKTAVYGHFKADASFPWEQTDMVELLTATAVQIRKKSG